jgi:uncharacterized membrane protein
MPTGRLDALSDGVFAIAITLLVLDLSVPPGSGDDLLGALVDAWPSYLAYVVSFATIGVAWLAHSIISHYTDRVDALFVRLNLVLLLVVSLLPFPTSLVAEYVDEHDAERVATTVLGVNLLLVALTISMLWRYAVRRGLVRADAADEEVQHLNRRFQPGLAGYVLLIGVGVFAPIAAVLGYLVIAIALLFPFGLRRHLSG